MVFVFDFLFFAHLKGILETTWFLPSQTGSCVMNSVKPLADPHHTTYKLVLGTSAPKIPTKQGQPVPIKNLPNHNGFASSHV